MKRRLPPPTRLLPLWLLLGGHCGLALLGCEIAEPQLPTFTTTLALPLGVERFEIADLIDDQDHLIALDDGTLGFWISGEPATVGLDFDLGASFPSQRIVGELGTFTLDLDSGVDVSFTLAGLYPAAAGLDGATTPVPAFTFASQSGAEDIADLRRASVAAGTLTISLSNGLPVAVSAEAGPDRLVLELRDPATAIVLASVDFDPIAPGGQAQRTADLAGVELPGEVAVRLAGGSPGSGGQAVPVDAQAAIAVQASFTGLRVSEAEAIVPAQSLATAFTTPLPADYGVAHAEISEGVLSVALTNEMAIACQATVVWAAVRDPAGQPLQLIFDLPGGGHQTREVDFAGHRVLAGAGELLAELAASVTVSSPGSGGQYVLLQADQGVRADISGGRLEFASVTGTVPAMSYDLVPVLEQVDLPDELDGLTLRRASLVLELTNTASVAALASFELVGINQAGGERTLQVAQAIEAASEDRAGITRVVLDETNSAVVDFLNHLPTEISLAGRVELGGDGALVTVRQGDAATVHWEIVSPVEVVIASSQLYGATKALDLEQDTRDLIEDHLGAAEVRLQILNHLPVGVQARLLFGTDPEALKTAPLLAVGPVAVLAGQTGDAGVVVEPRLSEPVVALTAAESRLLATAGLHSLIEVNLPSTEGDPVRIMTTDHLTVQGLVRLDVVVRDTR